MECGINFLNLDFLTSVNCPVSRKIKFKDTSFTNILGAWNNFRTGSFAQAEDNTLVETPVISRLREYLNFVDLSTFLSNHQFVDSRAIKLRDGMIKKLLANCASVHYDTEIVSQDSFAKEDVMEDASNIANTLSTPAVEEENGTGLETGNVVGDNSISEKKVVDISEEDIPNPIDINNIIEDESKKLVDSVSSPLIDPSEKVDFSSDVVDPSDEMESQQEVPDYQNSDSSFVLENGVYKLRRETMDDIMKPLKINIPSEEAYKEDFDESYDENMEYYDGQYDTESDETSAYYDCDALKNKIKLLQREQEKIDADVYSAEARANEVDARYAETVEALRIYADSLEDYCNESYNYVNEQNEQSKAREQEISEMVALMDNKE